MHEDPRVEAVARVLQFSLVRGDMADIEFGGGMQIGAYNSWRTKTYAAAREILAAADAAAEKGKAIHD